MMLKTVAPLVSRVLAAVIGGYSLAALASVAARVLPMPAPETVFTGMMASFLVYTGAVIWVFAVRSARRAWIGLLIAALPLLVGAYLGVWRGVAA
ncbi:DUF3649 domain-containing protein [Ottowia thiooxydans]|uniref:DUF3649 domain-containing protein n=1 Tax=Ottowia thiooxydans TaxID=219182 RepID=UPI003CCBF8B3